MLLTSLLSYTSQAVKPLHNYNIETKEIEGHPDFRETTDECFQSTPPAKSRVHHALFDTDSFPIKIDNCCSRTLTFNKKDFLPGTLQPVQNRQVTGYSGTPVTITHKGTIQWLVLDDQDKVQEIRIPNSYYVPNSTNRLLSPQHFAQQAKDHFPSKRGT